MAQLGFDYTGSGTSEDPYHVKTVGGFIYCVGQQGAIVFVDNDLDAKHDPVYREGIDEAISVSASYVYGICEPYSISKEYHVGEKCTYFDPDYGNRVYTCVRDCSCMSPLDTTYFSQGEPETAYACLRGLKVTSESFMKAVNGSSNIINICIDSCVHKKTGTVSYPTFTGSGTNKLYFSYCKIAMAIFCNGYTCMIDSSFIYLTKCAEYYKFVYQDITDRVDTRGVFVGYRSMCTVEFYNLAVVGLKHNASSASNSGGIIVSNASYTSFVGDIHIKVIDSNSIMTDTIAIKSSSDCFFAFTLTPYGLTGDPAVKFFSCSGISVFNKEQPETVATIDYSDYVVLATTAQCRDRDWLVSKGFIVG